MPEGEEMELMSSSNVVPTSGRESSQKERLPSRPERDSLNSSKEDLIMGREPSDDSLDSVKEVEADDEGSVSEPRHREFRDIAIGMSA